MAKPRIFISSTFYDLRQIRSDIDMFIENLGYEAIRNEEGNIPYGKDAPLEEYCYKEIKSIDILISIIGGRNGTESGRDSYSISQVELKSALKENKQVYIFIDKNVLSEFETYQLNKDNEDINYKFVDNKNIYKFIEEIKNLTANNNIKGFETASDITRYLKEQFAGLFQRFLEGQTKIKEISLIDSLEKTSRNLNQLVTFLTEQNKGQKQDINKILMVNHPLISILQEMLGITYNFYINGLEDLGNLLKARHFIPDTSNSFPWPNDFKWERKAKNGGKDILTISENIFDDEKKLKYFNSTNWQKSFVKLENIPAVPDDDLPF